MHFRVATRGFLKKNIFLIEFSLLASYHSPSKVAATQLHKKVILGQPNIQQYHDDSTVQYSAVQYSTALWGLLWEDKYKQI